MADETPGGSTPPADAPPPAPPAGETPPAGGETPPAGDPPTGEAPPPVVYDLKLPEGSTLDAALLERTAAIARERGLSPEHAQAAVDLVASELTTRESELLAAHAPGGAAWVQQHEAWKAEALADTEIGGTPEKLDASVALAKQALQKFADPEALEFLEQTGLGSNPATLKLFTRIGRAMSEGSFVKPAGSGAPLSVADALYGEVTAAPALQ